MEVELKMQQRPNNRPKKGSMITVDPIRDIQSILEIKNMLSGNPRNYAIFILGCNTNLRASDIVKITVGQVRGLKAGDSLFCLKEQKTGKNRRITVNQAVFNAVSSLLSAMPHAQDSDFLFQSRNGGNKALCVESLCHMVKEWCRKAGLKGNYGSHTLRKTWAFQQYSTFKVPVPTLMEVLNHSSQRQTLCYIGIQPKEIENVYMNEI